MSGYFQTLLSMFVFLGILPVVRDVFFSALCSWRDALALVSSPSFLSTLPRTRSTHSTCTLGSAWENMERLQQLFCLTGLGHRWDGWLPLSRRHQQLILRIFFIHLQDPPLWSPYMGLSLWSCTYLCNEICMFSIQFVRLCRWKTCRARTIKESQHCLVTAFFGSEGTVIYYWLACLRWKQGAEWHGPAIIFAALIFDPFSSRLTFILQTVQNTDSSLEQR